MLNKHPITLSQKNIFIKGEREESMPAYKMLISSENLEDSADLYPIKQMIFAKFK